MKILLPLILALALSSSPPLCFAEGARDYDTFEIKKNLSDGRHGNWREWRTTLQERAVQTITASVQLQSGSKDTYVSLGFDGGEWFEPTKVTVEDESLRDVSWNAGGEFPKGRPLLMKGYNGAVKVHEVTVHYAGDERPMNTPLEDTKKHQAVKPKESDVASLPISSRPSPRTLMLDLKEATEVLYRRVSDDSTLGTQDVLVDAAQDLSRKVRHVSTRVNKGGEITANEIKQIEEQLRFLKEQIDRTGGRDEGLQRKIERVAEFLKELQRHPRL